MHLHLSVDAGMVAPLEVDPLPLHQRPDALRAVAAPDRRVPHAVDALALEVGVLGLDAAYLPGHLRRFHLDAGVGRACAAVILPDAVEPPVVVHSIPAHREGPGVAPVQPAPNRPAIRDLEGGDDVGVDAVGVVLAVVAPLCKDLAGEGVPVAIQQGVALLLRHRGQPGDVVRVVLQQDFIVKHRGGDEDAGLPPRFLAPVRVSDLHLLPDRLHGFARRDEPLLDPPVAHAPGVGLRPHIAAGPRPVGAVPGEQVAVLVPQKLRQLVKVDEVIALALVIHPVLGMLHGPEVDFRAAGEGPDVLALVELGLFVCAPVYLRRAVHQLRELRVGLAQDKAPVVRYLHLAQSLGQGAVRFPAASRAPIQGLVLEPGHERSLARLRSPYHVSHPQRLLLRPAVRGCA